MNKFALMACCAITLFGCGQTTTPNPALNSTATQETPTTVPAAPLTTLLPAGPNSWVLNNPQQNESVITDDGIRHWQQPTDIIASYVRLDTAGTIDVALVASVEAGQSVIDVSLNGSTKRVTINNTVSKQVYVGQFPATAGYQRIELRGISKQGAVFANVDQLAIGGTAVNTNTQYIRDEFYWGRRGPSVHLSYNNPTSEQIDYFYSELTVPTGQDVEGSYYMSNGFAEGYFGIQVNGPSERRVLFSVWSPNPADDPNQIPAEDRVLLLRKGPQVTSGEFGNEGAGGQSYLLYPWRAGTTYRFLLKAVPSSATTTDYTAWFYAPEQAEWRLIASFRRPKTNTYVRSMHSFLENFLPDYGNQTRSALYGNGWVHTKSGQWLALQQAHFSFDDTARRKSRWDYQGGVNNGSFFLKNGGFFNDYTPESSSFTRATTTAPDITLTTLP